MFSEEENKKVYGQVAPPEYDITRIRAPVALFVGEEDQLADPLDSENLSKKLKNLVNYQVVSINCRIFFLILKFLI